MDGMTIFALIILIVLIVAIVAIWIVLGMLPGKIARQRNHPQADAINMCGWWGVITMGLLLPVAWIWAYTNPTGNKPHPSQSTSEEGGTTMIVFLTLIYVAVLFSLLKLKFIKLTLWWKISPAVWMLLLLIVLFIPMQWGAPAGATTQYQTVVEIIPNVSGQVIDVPAKALTSMKKGEVLFKLDPRTFQDQVDDLEASLKLAKINLKRAKDLYAKNLGSEVDVDRFDAEAQQLIARLNTAKYNLEETVVKAPSDGYVIALTLRPGQRVANLPLRSWVAYVSHDQERLMLGVNQNMLRHVKPGQEAELVLKLYPGKVFKATVETIAYMTPQGQLPPSGTVPSAPTTQQIPLPYGVVLKLNNDAGDLPHIPGGALGSGTIYTDSVKMTHIIRKVMLRMETLVNFVNPY